MANYGVQDDTIIHIDEYKSGLVTCVICKKPLSYVHSHKKGFNFIDHHFIHTDESNCIITEHRLAQELIIKYQSLLKFYHKCKCSRLTFMEYPTKSEFVKEQSYHPPLKYRRRHIDIGVIHNEKVIGAIEVCTTNPLPDDKITDLKNIFWCEVSGIGIIRSIENKKYNIEIGRGSISQCDNCKANRVQLEIKIRSESCTHALQALSQTNVPNKFQQFQEYIRQGMIMYNIDSTLIEEHGSAVPSWIVTVKQPTPTKAIINTRKCFGCGLNIEGLERYKTFCDYCFRTKH